MKILTTISNKKYFWLFVFLHVIIWTIVLNLTRNALDTSGDTVENYAWGIGWQPGYFKHPPFTAHLVALWFKILPNSNFYYILLSQILVACCFLAVFQINSYYLPANLAITSVIILEFIPFFSFLDIKVNPNSVLVAILMWVSLFAYRAVVNDKLIDWLLLAITAAIAILTKYTAGVLLLSLLLLILVTKEGRQCFVNFKIYLSGILFLAIISPHIYWLFTNDFMSFAYASKHLEEGFWKKIKVLAILIKFTLFILIPFAILKFVIGVSALKLPKSRDFKSLFPWFITVVPIVVIVLMAVFLGSRVSSRWMKPFLCCMPLLFLLGSASNFKTLSEFAVNRIKKIVISYLLIVPSIYLTASGFFDSLSKKYQAPLAQIANELQKQWDQEFATKLHFVTGSYLLSNSVSFYAKDHPLSWLNFNYKISPWINPEDMKKKGVAIICYSPDYNCISKARDIWPNLNFRAINIQPKRHFFNIQGTGEFKYAFIAPKK